MNSPFEAFMIFAFGVSWPVSIIKTVRSNSVSGKSPLFLLLVFLGYVSGIIHKVRYNLDWVIAMYLLNALMVFADLVIVLVKSHRLKPAA